MACIQILYEDPFSNTTRMRKARYRLNEPKSCSKVKKGRIIHVGNKEGREKSPAESLAVCP